MKEEIFERLAWDYIPQNASRWSVDWNAIEWTEIDVPQIVFTADYEPDGDFIRFSMYPKDRKHLKVQICEFFTDYTYDEVWIAIAVSVRAVQRTMGLFMKEES